MVPRARAIICWEIAGAIFTTLVGSALHFAFDWSGGWPPLALLAAVNESIWEHLKLAFWPGLLWAMAVPTQVLGFSRSQYLSSKGLTLLLTAILIITVFTTYTHILGRNLLVLDIGTFVLAVAAGQSVSAWLAIYGMRQHAIFRLGQLLLVLQLAAYGLLTFFAPEFWLFIDSRTGLVGISRG